MSSCGVFREWDFAVELHGPTLPGYIDVLAAHSALLSAHLEGHLVSV